MNSVVFRRKFNMTTRSGPYLGFELSLKFPDFSSTNTLIEMAECSVTNFLESVELIILGWAVSGDI